MITLKPEVEKYRRLQFNNAVNTLKYAKIPDNLRWLDLGCGFGKKNFHIRNGVKL